MQTLERIEELVEPITLRRFEFFQTDENISIKPYSVNIIVWDSQKTKEVEAFISDTTFINPTNSKSPIIKHTVVFSEIIEYKNGFAMLWDKLTNKKYVVEQINVTRSPQNPDEAASVAIISDFEAFQASNDIYIVLTREHAKNPLISLHNASLVSNVYSLGVSGVKKLVDLEKTSPILVHPVDTTRNAEKMFLPFFKFFENTKMADMRITNPSTAQINTLNEQAGFKKLFEKLEEIIQNAKTIETNFLGKSEEYKTNFQKTIYGGNDSKQYTNYALREFENSADNKWTSEEFRTFILLCSSFLTSDYCVNGGYTNEHKNVFPFYIEYDGFFTLKSNYFDLGILGSRASNEQYNVLVDKKFNKVINSLQEISENNFNAGNYSYSMSTITPDHYKFLVRWPFEKLQWQSTYYENEQTYKSFFKFKNIHKNLIDRKKIKLNINYDELGEPTRTGSEAHTTIKYYFLTFKKLNELIRTQEGENYTIINNLVKVKEVETVYSGTVQYQDSLSYEVHYNSIEEHSYEREIGIADAQTGIELSVKTVKPFYNSVLEGQIATEKIITKTGLELQIGTSQADEENSQISEMQSKNYVYGYEDYFNYVGTLNWVEPYELYTLPQMDKTHNKEMIVKGVWIPGKLKISGIEHIFFNENVQELKIKYIEN
ncbi:hypothetical protein [Mycoplasma simbae]|uniref:hypothetical protein n=1 Tax=Mycoplasma simbae TaxID=36744 RepID=UPI00049692B4|nr:hypothetical protein [Mycoplasma simbae]